MTFVVSPTGLRHRIGFLRSLLQLDKHLLGRDRGFSTQRHQACTELTDDQYVRNGVHGVLRFPLHRDRWTNNPVLLVLVEHSTRRVHVAGITRHPNSEWVTQVARNMTDVFDGVLNNFRFLIRDRDTSSLLRLTQCVQQSGPGSSRHTFGHQKPMPLQNVSSQPFAALSGPHLILNKRHALHILYLADRVEPFGAHYNAERPHYGIDLNTPPIPNNVVSLTDGGKLRCTQRVGGLDTHLRHCRCMTR